MVRLASFFLAIVLIATACSPKTTVPQAQAPPPPPPPLPTPALEGIPIDSATRIGVLPNGMTYYIRANGKPEHRAELRLALKAGSMQEDDDQLGLAHFIEHMAFNGSAHFSKNELVNYLEKAGSRFGPDLNAYTSFDETVYMLQVRTDAAGQLDTGLLILQDWANGIAFAPEEIDKERGVVISEWRSRLGAEQRMQQAYLPYLYYRSRYAARLPIGDTSIIRHAPYGTVSRFYADWYRPELMAILVVGDIDPDQIEARLKASFGTWIAPSPARPKAPAAIAPYEGTFVKVLTDPEATQTRIQVIYKHPKASTVSVLDYRQRLVETLATRMLSKRLSDLAQAPDPPFTAGFASYGNDIGDLATYTALAIAEPAKLQRAFNALLEENRRVQLHGFTAGELEREKAVVRRQAEQAVLEASKSESSRLVRRMISHYLNKIPMPSEKQHLSMYESMLPTITLDEVGAVIRRLITDRNRVVLLTANASDAAMLPDSAALTAMLVQAATAQPAPYEDVDLSAPIVRGDFSPVAVRDIRVDTVTGIHAWTLANGIRVLARPTDFKNDEILMNAYSPGGHSLYPDALYPSASMAAGVVSSSGIGTYKATALSKKLAGKRVSVRPGIFERYETLSGSSAKADLELMLQLVYGYVTDFREDESVLANQVAQEKTLLTRATDNPQNWFGDRVERVKSGHHPRRGFPTPAYYDSITLKRVLDVYADRFGDLGDMTFFFVGNVDPDSLRQLTARYLGALPAGGRTESGRDIGVRFPAGPVDSTYFRGEAPRANVSLTFHGSDVIHPDSAYLLSTLVDVARIKLRESLREDQGGVYGVSIFGNQSRYPVPQYEIEVEFNADPPAAEGLITAALNVLRKLKQEVDPVDIQKVTEIQRQGRARDIKQNSFWMSAMINGYLQDVPVSTFVSTEELLRRIGLVTPQRLNGLARKYFDERELIRMVMYPATWGRD